MGIIDFTKKSFYFARQCFVSHRDVNYENRSMGINRIYINFEKADDAHTISILIEDKVFLLFLELNNLKITTPERLNNKKGITLKNETISEFKEIIKPFKKYSIEALNKVQIIDDIAKAISSYSQVRERYKYALSLISPSIFITQIEKESQFLDGIDELLSKKQKKELEQNVKLIVLNEENSSNKNSVRRHKI